MKALISLSILLASTAAFAHPGHPGHDGGSWFSPLHVAIAIALQVVAISALVRIGRSNR